MPSRLPAGDILIHAGDFTSRGTRGQVKEFCEWFAGQPHPHKVRNSTID